MESRSGYAAVKAEYLLKHEKKEQKIVPKTGSSVDTSESLVSVVDNDAQVDTVEEQTNAKRKHGEAVKTNHTTTKKRHQESHPTKEDRLCSFVAKGEACPFKTECKYNHDALDYLSKKPIDLGPVCYQYVTFGYCNNGIMCRFGDCHIDRIRGASFSRSAEDGGIIDRVQINNLRKDVQLVLRKKKYDEYIKGLKAAASTEVSVSVDAGVAIVTSSAPTCSEGAASSVAKEVLDTTVDSSIAGSETRRSLKQQSYNLSAFPDKCVKLVDFSNKVYVAPLTTVGNLPFRRILKEFGADITCGEMAMAANLEAGQASEWALLRRHPGEDVFGVQIAGNHSDMMSRVGRILEHETSTDFVDINCGCPIDVVCNRGCGSSLMNKHNKLCDIVAALAKNLPSRSITVKVRTGWDEKNPTTHKLVPMLQKCTKDRIAAIMIHGRSRLQRYSKLANWDYVLQAAQSQDSSLRRIPVIGNGDIFSWEDWRERQQYMTENIVNDSDPEAVGLCSCAMLGRGALIKPWLPAEIKEQRMIDISATERLDMLKKFCNYGLEHWGSDQQGINTTRRFLLEWLSFLHRYIPLSLLESTQRMNHRPPHYFGRCDLETLMCSQNSADWVRISELLLGPVPDGFNFTPKHKSNSYSAESESVSNG